MHETEEEKKTHAKIIYSFAETYDNDTLLKLNPRKETCKARINEINHLDRLVGAPTPLDFN